MYGVGLNLPENSYSLFNLLLFIIHFTYSLFIFLLIKNSLHLSTISPGFYQKREDVLVLV